MAYGLESFAAISAGRGDAVAAGRLLGAAQTLRRRKGILNTAAFEFYMIALEGLRAAGQGDALDAAIKEGLDLSVAQALEYVRD
jgi:hypothetical protein